SILGKKLAAGLDALVLDVKFGSGAFLPRLDDADELAKSLVSVANGCGLRTHALLTDMNFVLGLTAGNALEVRECLDVLTGTRREARLLKVTLTLAAEMLTLGRLSPDTESAKAAALQALQSGAAAEKFVQMVAELGGPADLLRAPDKHLAAAPVQ